MLEQIISWLDIHWFSSLVGLFFLGMMLYGHKKGLVRLLLSMGALLLTLFLSRAALPGFSRFLQERTGLRELASVYVAQSTGLYSLQEEQVDTEADREQILSGLALPEGIQDILKKNSEKKLWDTLGVDSFASYVADSLSSMMLNCIAFVLLFCLIWLGLQLLFTLVDFITGIPVIHGLNQIAGAFLGLLEALVFVWLFFLLLGFFETSQVGGRLTALIRDSVWLNFLYQNNGVAFFLRSLILELLA